MGLPKENCNRSLSTTHKTTEIFDLAPKGSGTSSDNSKGGLDTSCASGITQLDLVSPNYFAVLEDPEQEEKKMLDLDTVEPEEIAQDKCLGNKAEEGIVKERTPEESDLAHRSEDLEERVNYGSD
ncbi:hypothetical protein BC332_21537 [Capsicum chinense]|nr:hypothetical protein BC332_21537 [Capsicum chinense]